MFLALVFLDPVLVEEDQGRVMFKEEGHFNGVTVGGVFVVFIGGGFVFAGVVVGGVVIALS